MTTIEVVIPYYRGDPAHLREALTSLVRQSDPSWLATVLDDASPDTVARDEVERLGDGRIRYLRHESNRGVSGSFNHAVQVSRGEWTVIMGQDDRLLPDYVTTIRSAAPRTDVAFIQPGVRVIDAAGEVTRPLADTVKSLMRPRGATLLRGQTAAASLLTGDWLYFPSIAWRTRVTREVGFDPGLATTMDLDHILKLLVAGHALQLIDPVVFEYRRHPASESSHLASHGHRFHEERTIFRKWQTLLAGRGWWAGSLAAKAHLTSRLHILLLHGVRGIPERTHGDSGIRVVDPVRGQLGVPEGNLNGARPDVSVVIPAYQAASTLRNTLVSVLAQSGVSLEVLVVNDGSTDATSTVLQEFCDDSRVSVVTHRVNRGVAAALNSGMARAAGATITQIGADDTMAPGYLAHLFTAMSDDVDLVVGNHVMVHPGGRRVKAQAHLSGSFIGAEAAIHIMHNRVGGLAAGKLTRNVDRMRVEYPVGLRRGEDLAVAVALAARARRVVVCNEFGYEYRVRETSATWGAASPVDEAAAAVGVVRDVLTGGGATVHTYDSALAVLDVWTKMVAAHSVMSPGVLRRDAGIHRGGSCTRPYSEAIRWRHIGATALSGRADLALAAMTLKTVPAFYRHLYLRHARRQYGLGSAATS